MALAWPIGLNKPHNWLANFNNGCMRNTVLILHIISSLLVCILTLILLLRSIIALKRKLPILKIDSRMPLCVVILLYTQLLLGMLLFYFIINDYNINTSKIAEHGRYWMRFWAVEHFTLMIFTVVLGHIGYIYNKNLKNPESIFRKNRLYFGITFVLICISMTMGIIR
jgi:hypothetical protein